PPPAPGLFSITTGLPSRSVSRWPSSRATMSVPAPAGYATIQRTARSGHAAAAGTAPNSIMAPAIPPITPRIVTSLPAPVDEARRLDAALELLGQGAAVEHDDLGRDLEAVARVVDQ